MINGEEIIDHSPSQPEAAPPIPTASNVILIDNYDSFTYNVYQYLVLEGGKVTVHRNDETTLKKLIASQPTHLVISPGPGNPEEDAGVSNDAIAHFAGKIPVLGVCMGEQCIFTVFGGKVEMTGEILHGKTSPIRHDSKGVFAGLPQDLPATRYHSLAGTHLSLPESLVVSAWIQEGPDGGRGIIMGVRHKELLVEGVQFHPESILTADGRPMIRNFLHMRGGTWKENDRLSESVESSASHKKQTSNERSDEPISNGIKTPAAASADQPSILTEIFNKRRRAVEQHKSTPSMRPSDLQEAYDLNLSPPQIDFTQRLRQSPFTLSLMAEVKRASPSKGDIAPNICAPAQAKKYALAGASVISVLTEPEYFKGSIDDMRSVRQILSGMLNRPAVLRKEFIFSTYQILEARLAGADSVLLIVKMLSTEVLSELYHYSLSLGMEPLVEVNTVDEMKTALSLNAKVIGVNNRNLANFEVDLETTSRLMDGVPKSTVVCALSGISGPSDVAAYRQNNVSAVLVGEALMRASDINTFVNNLLGVSAPSPSANPAKSARLVKICGTRTRAGAEAAIRAGADMIGMILVPGRKRCVDIPTALDILDAIRKSVPNSHSTHPHPPSSNSDKYASKAIDAFTHRSSNWLSHPHRPLLVGVFQNQPLHYILSMQRLLSLDIVQLHGSEPLEWANLIPVPVIKRFGAGDVGLGTRGYHALPLLDSAKGGTGEKVDLEGVKAVLRRDKEVRVLLAGGLDGENIGEILGGLGDLRERVVGVDVSSGIETEGEQDLEKVASFVAAAKGVN